MVKVGFVVEGTTEKLVLESEAFQSVLKNLNLSTTPTIHNAQGNGNLLPRNIESYTKMLLDDEADVIVILTDQDDDTCVTNTKNRIGGSSTKVVCVKSIEAWFLADSRTLSLFLQTPNYRIELPESYTSPFEEIRNVRLKLTGKGVSDKVRLAKKMIDLGFSLQNAAQHPNCPSAKYFLRKLEELAKT